MDLIQASYDERYYCTPHFDTSHVDLDVDPRSQGCEKANVLHQLSHKFFDRFEWNFVYC